MPELDCERPRILLVATGLDEVTERIVNYLSQRHGVDINDVLFAYFDLGTKKILGRSLLMPESIAPSAQFHRQSLGGLLAMAKANGTTSLVEVCREIGKGKLGPWGEEYAGTAGGSFRFWTAQNRMAFGVNASGQLANAPHGKLDVWVRPEILAELTEKPEEDVAGEFKIFHPFPSGKMSFVIRLAQEADAEKLLAILRTMAGSANQPAAG